MKRAATLTVVSVVLALAILLSPQAGRAQSSDADWGEILNPDGSVNWDNLTYVGETSEPADWMAVSIGGVSIPVGEATYNQYVTPSGQILVLPSPTTMFFSYLNPAASGLAGNPPAVLQNGAGTLAMVFGAMMNGEQLQSAGYTSSEDFFQAVISGRENIWTFLGPAQALSFLTEIVRLSLQSGYPITALWLYDSAMCAAIPGGCPAGLFDALTPEPGATPAPETTPAPDQPPPVTCPDPFTRTGPITVSGAGPGGLKAPLKPVVVGQDPERRGVDLEVTVQVPPVEYHYFVPVPRTERRCVRSASGNGGGCPGPGSRYSGGWNSSKAGNPNWKVSTSTTTVCEEHVLIFPDPIRSTQVSVNLTAASRAWIQTELAAAYPGARLRHPRWAFSFPGPGSRSGDTVLWTQLIPAIQVVDPGSYQTTVSGVTAGTPVSAPREFSQDLGVFPVELLRVTLIGQP